MPRISVWFPDHAEGEPLEVMTYGLFNNKSITDVPYPLYVHDPDTGDLVETDYLVIGKVIPEDGGNE